MKPRLLAISLIGTFALAGCASNNLSYNEQANARLGGDAQNRPPRLIYSENPVFPPGPQMSGKANWTLEIQVGFVVDATGAVRDPVVLKSTDSFYNTLALDAIRRWRFEPGMKDGKPVAARMTAPFQFKLQQP